MNRYVCLAGAAMLIGAGEVMTDSISVVEHLPAAGRTEFYAGARAPLRPSPLVKLPIGAVQPAGWLRVCLDRQRNGLTGRLGEISAWLQKDGNAWLSPEGTGAWGWEEVPYWLRGYAAIGYFLDDRQMIEEASIWIEGAIRGQRDDGDFGPVQRFDDDGSRDFWANMVMLSCLQAHHEYTGDERVLDLMRRYFRFQLTVPDDEFLTHYWQRMRGGDNLLSVYWLYNRTGEGWLLDLAEKIHRNTADWAMPGDLPNWHNVNIAQGFREPATYWVLSGEGGDLRATYDSFHLVRERFGQMPGGMFAGDENCRAGSDDPRQGIETCGMVEQMLSDEILLGITGDLFWADHCEDVAFNSLPAAFMPDYRSLRYLTGANMVLSDAADHSPGVQNKGPFLLMNPLSHRCCQHNHSHGWSDFVEHLWMATLDGGACAAIYGPSTATVRVGAGVDVRIEEQTQYPFEESIRLVVGTPEPVSFPLYLRIPGWCSGARVAVDGAESGPDAPAHGYFRINRTWKDGDSVELILPMQTRVRRWAANHNAVSVYHGPLALSLKIAERVVEIDSAKAAVWDAKWQPDVDAGKWPAFEIHPAAPWNYGLVLDRDDPDASFSMQRKAWPADGYPFEADAVPISWTASARRITEWELDEYGLCAPLQDSPVRSDAPTDTVTLIPMGAARLRISAFPTIGDGPGAHRWSPPEPEG